MSETQKAIEEAARLLRAGTPKGGAATQAQLTAALALDKAFDDVEWTEKGLAEWRTTALEKARHLAAVQATARIAIGHLQAVLNKARTFDEQQRAETAALDWLTSIGSEPT